MKSVTLKHSRRKSSIDCSEPKLTTQAHKNMCDLNLVLAQYAKQNLPIPAPTVPLRFIDNSTIPSLEEAFDLVNSAYNEFSNLPPQVRKLMDNNPANLEKFISDPENADILIKHGVLITKPAPPASSVVDPVGPNKESKQESNQPL